MVLNEGLGPSQKRPDGDWSAWVFLGGRGAGKTYAGATFLLGEVGKGRRLALVGPTLHDVREVMVDGPSGLKTLSPWSDRPRWEASRRRLVWPRGGVAYGFSAEDPDSLRGPQFHAAWADEFCAWRKPGETLAMLRLALRLGDRPLMAVTTTPKPLPALRTLLREAGVERTDARTADNAHNLSHGFVDQLMAIYGGSRLAAQELDGVLTEAPEGALWTADLLSRCRGERPERLETVVLAVDPPASAGGDACGIVVAGRGTDGRAYVLSDRTAAGMSPLGWATRVVEAANAYTADRIVAEANQGGDMVRQVLEQAGPRCPVRLVHASRGKAARAEPVALLYEQGRVTHVGAFPQLEEELMGVGAEEGPRKSPDRADALVWAIAELMLGPTRQGPRVTVF